ncbi:T9SS type A sorting domain-containing protein [Chryseobacterium sp. JM1]|uniref:T9SS type A sorting domain-containing protein n=1 Tax=Chryseobacterium sp. JM1 TaxID=1233950 RepID=UPI0004E7157B|nr:T9SS type A sorting domain-containing protein [Chryseobacterium sp. JM1]KFF21702.1 hypothetical protein IW22_07120 [Chryseobacterium sp. JM1]
MTSNPAKDHIILSTDCKSPTTIVVTITDMLGKTIVNSFHKADSGKNTITIDINKLSTGVYFVKIQDIRGASAVHKLIKE